MILKNLFCDNTPLVFVNNILLYNKDLIDRKTHRSDLNQQRLCHTGVKSYVPAVHLRKGIKVFFITRMIYNIVILSCNIRYDLTSTSWDDIIS